MNIILEFLYCQQHTPLLTAVYHGYTALITQLWPEHKNDVTEEGLPALHYAAKLGREEVIRALIECGADINDDAGVAETPLITACTHDQSHIVKVLLEYPDIDVNRKKGGSGWFRFSGLSYSALYIACDNGFVECVRALLTSDSLNINVGNAFTPPMVAAVEKGHVDVVEVMYPRLSTREADLMKNKWNLLLKACHSGHENMVRYLLDSVKVKIVAEQNGTTPFMEAARMGHVGVVRVFHERILNGNIIENGVHEMDIEQFVNGVDVARSTALHMACREGHLNVVQYLIEEMQIDFSKKDYHGDTALDIAKTEAHAPIISWWYDYLCSDAYCNRARRTSNDSKCSRQF